MKSPIKYFALGVIAVLSAGAAVTITSRALQSLNQLPQDGATTGQAIVWNGSVWGPDDVTGTFDATTYYDMEGTGGFSNIVNLEVDGDATAATFIGDGSVLTAIAGANITAGTVSTGAVDSAFHLWVESQSAASSGVIDASERLVIGGAVVGSYDTTLQANWDDENPGLYWASNANFTISFIGTPRTWQAKPFWLTNESSSAAITVQMEPFYDVASRIAENEIPIPPNGLVTGTWIYNGSGYMLYKNGAAEYPNSAFVGPTNELVLVNTDVYYTATGNVGVTNVTGALDGETREVTLNVTNSTAGNITFYYSGGGFPIGVASTPALVIPAAKVGMLGIREGDGVRRWWNAVSQ